MRMFVIITSLMILMSGVCMANVTNVDDSCLVRVVVTYQQYDSFMPWQKTRTEVKYGYGVIVGNSRVMTTENLVRNNTLVELMKVQSGEKITAEVELSDYQVNLAMLRVNDTNALAGCIPLQVAAHLPGDASVEIMQFDENRKLQRGTAHVIQMTMAVQPSALRSSLMFKLSSDLNINGEGAPVIYEGQLAGMVMNYEQSTRTANILPCPVLSAFLDDAESPFYKGIAAAGFEWTELVDPAKRAYLNVQRPNAGILVLSVLPGTGASEVLAPNDVILEWDKCPIDNLGFYQDTAFGRLNFSYLISGRRKPGEQSTVLIVRNGVEMTVNVNLTRRMDGDSLIPENVTYEQPEYIVEGGLVLRELSGEYIRAHGGNWRRLIGSRLAHIYETHKNDVTEKGDRVVILSGILPDPINIGYEYFRNISVNSVNGQPVHNLKDVFKIAEKDGCIDRIELQSVGMELILDKEKLSEANARISKLYHIPNLRYKKSE